MKPALKNFEEASQIFSALIKPTVMVLLWMSLLRMLLFVGVFSGQIGLHPDLGAAFFAGFRFDLLVLGFVWIPILVLTWAWSLFASPQKLFFIWKLYLATVVLIVLEMSWLDLLWTAAKNARLNSEFFDSSIRIVIDSGWVVLGRTRAMIFTFAMLISCLGILLSIYWQPQADSSEKVLSRRNVFLKMLVFFLGVSLAARGTWTPHHLNIEHAQVSEEPLVNELPVNPIWNMDK